MKKLLFLIDSLGGGGAEKVLITLLANLNPDKYEITLCTVVDVGVHVSDIPSWIKYRPILRYPKSKKDLILYKIKYKLIHNILPLSWVAHMFLPRNNDIGIAYVEGFSTKLMSALSGKRMKKIAWVHVDLVSEHWIGKVFKNRDEESRCYNSYDCIVGVSETVTSGIKKLYNVKRAVTLYNPIDSRSILENVPDATNQIDHSDDAVKLISIGRLVSQKGYDRLLIIFKRLIEEGFNAKLKILGEGSQRGDLENFIKENDLDGYVELPGFVSSPYAEIACSDLFVCSSRAEGYSTAVTESLILGIPVVTTECSGMREMLGDNEYGVITDNDTESLYRGIKGLLADSEKLKYYRSQAAKRGEFFALDRQIANIEKLLDE